MDCISVEKVVNALVDPLRHSLQDQDQCVRQTAATVSKLHLYDELLVEIEGFMDIANCSKVIMYLINDMIKEYDITNMLTSFSSEPEVQYVTLCNILLIIQIRPDVLRNNIKIDWLIGCENSTAELFIAALLEIYPKKVNYVLPLS
nr:13793_t:CDS:2 [Entrophospora candida]